MPGGTIRVYISSVSSNLETKKQQQRICMVLDGKKIDFEQIDISTDDAAKSFMREKSGSLSLPPQIFNGDQYCGDFGQFDESVETETLNEFLKL